MNPRLFLRSLFDAAVANASPALCVKPHLPSPPKGRTLVLGIGKGAAAMAKEVEDHWDGPLSGLVITRYGHSVPVRSIEVVEAGHPVPDEAGFKAAARMLLMASELREEDLLLFLVSGGGSALASVPAPGITLGDKQAVNRALLKSPARISEINAVRKHLSAFKGGRLALTAHPAAVRSLIISDVPGDDPSVVASGPTAPDGSTQEEARAVLQRYGIIAPPGVTEHLADPAHETPKPGDGRFARVENIIIATPRSALEEAAALAELSGVHAVLLGDSIEGEARSVGRIHAELALAHAGKRPCVLVSGGETTVHVQGGGRGGRNSEYLLSLTLALNGAPGISALAADTDGIDGTEDNAGALTFPDTLARARALGLDAGQSLARNDSYGMFESLGDLVTTGPTRTNVNDFRAILIA